MHKPVAIVVLACLPLAALASPPPPATAPAAVSTIEGSRDGKLLFFQVRIDGKGPFWFCLDSGASHTVLDPTLVRELGLTIVGAGKTTGTGAGEVPVQHLRPLTIELGGARVRVDEPWVIDLSGVPIPKSTRGLIGAELFERFVVEIEPDHPRLGLYEPPGFRVASGATTLPLIAREHRFFVPVTVEAKGKRAEREARIDTGSEESVADPLAKEAREVRSTTLGQGLGKDYQAVSGKLDRIQLGSYELRAVWAPGTDKTMIGMEIFRRFTTTFEVSRGQLHLQPNAHLNEPVPPPESP